MDRLISQLPFFTPEHRDLAQSVTQFVTQEIEPRAAVEEDVENAAREFVRLLAGAGLLKYAVAESKIDVRSLCLIREELAYSSALADLAFVMQGLGTYAIARAAPEHVRDFWVSRAANGKAIAAFALTEPNAGSDVAAIETTARRDGETYVIDGKKRFISNAGIADFYIVFAKTGTRDDGRPVLSAFVVGSKMPGFRVVERTSLIAPHPIGEIDFNECRVPAEDMVGEEGDGFKLAMETMDTFRASVGAAACGMARRALDQAVRYASGRKQFGRLLSEHQLIQAKLADMITELDAARLLVYRAAYARRDARSIAVRLHSHGARERTERTRRRGSSCIARRTDAGDFLHRAGTSVSVNRNCGRREDFFIARIGQLLHPGVAQS